MAEKDFNTQRGNGEVRLYLTPEKARGLHQVGDLLSQLSAIAFMGIKGAEGGYTRKGLEELLKEVKSPWYGGGGLEQLEESTFKVMFRLLGESWRLVATAQHSFDEIEKAEAQDGLQAAPEGGQ